MGNAVKENAEQNDDDGEGAASGLGVGVFEGKHAIRDGLDARERGTAGGKGTDEQPRTHCGDGVAGGVRWCDNGCGMASTCDGFEEPPTEHA